MQCNAIGRSLTAFTNGFSFSSTSKSIHISAFLTPAASSAAHVVPPWPARTFRRQSRRQTFTTCNRIGQEPRSVDHEAPAEAPGETNILPGLFDNGSQLSASCRRSKIGRPRARRRAVSNLDPYLPLELRSESWLTNLANFQGVRDEETLPETLVEGAKASGTNPLSTIAIDQGRWDALLYLTSALLRLKPSDGSNLQYSKAMLAHSPWNETCLPPDSLHDLTDTIIHIEVHHFDHHRRQLRKLDDIIDSTLIDESTARYQSAMAEIWECLGNILLHLSTLELSAQQEMLPWVHRIVGQMHSADAIPRGIYDYDSSDIPPVRRKPVFLHAMSARIMASTSDSVWKSIEHDTITNSALNAMTYALKGQEMPGARLNPRISPLSVGTWLEFVMWACVHDGHASVATRLLTQAANIEASPNWSLISWNEVESLASQRALEKRDAYESQSWFSKLTSASEGYSQDASLVEMPTHTISKEVVMALLDNTAAENEDDRVDQINEIVDAYAALSGERESFENDLFYNSVVLRGISISPRAFEYPKQLLVLPSLAEAIKEPSRFTSFRYKKSKLQSPLLLPDDRAIRAMLSPSNPANIHRTNYLHANGVSSSNSSDRESKTHASALVDDFAKELSSPWHGVLLSSVVHAIDSDLLMETLEQFRQLQNLVDRERLAAIFNFRHTAIVDEEDATTRLRETNMQIPQSTGVALLDMATNANLMDLAWWLLYSQDPDGPLIPPDAYTIGLYQPSLLRYAAAASEYHLIVKITKMLSTELSAFSTDLLKALLDCQSKLGKFDSVGDVMSFLCYQRQVALDEFDVIGIGCAYLDLEARQGYERKLKKAQELLTRLLSLEFLPRQDPAQRVDYNPQRLLNQLGRMFSNVPGGLGEIALPLIVLEGPETSSVAIKPSAFNLLLDRIKEHHGFNKARQFFELWCHSAIDRDDPIIVPSTSNIPVVPMEKLVTPNTETMRILLGGMEREHLSNAQLVNRYNWAQTVSTRMGLGAETFDYLFPSKFGQASWFVTPEK